MVNLYIFDCYVFFIIEKPSKIFRGKLTQEAPKKRIIEKEPEYGEPPKYYVKKSQNIETTKEINNLTSDEFDYVPKRLR